MKKYMLVFLSAFLIISAPFHAANAGFLTSTGKYLVNAVKSTPTAVVVSAKNTTTGATHTIKHGISSQELASAVGAGVVGLVVGNGVGLAFQAITGVALNAVDWVMDKENNGIKWKPKPSESDGMYPAQYGNSPTFYGSTPYAAALALCSSVGGKMENTPRRDDEYFYMHYCDKLGDTIVITKNSKILPQTEYKSVPFQALAEKTIDLAKSSNPVAQKTVEDFVTNLAKKGQLDDELDNAVDITKADKECTAGYEKVGQICLKKPDKDDKECPVGTIKVGEYCMKEPDDDDNEATQCGDCCDELQLILITMAQMNNEFYINSLDNDAQMLVNLQLLNDQLDAIATDFSELLAEAKESNQTLTEINNNQTLHFNELKQKVDELKNAVETGNADILAKLAEVQAAIDLTNLKLDEVNQNLNKINDNLEKMQKCNETEFNKKICDFIDWVKQEPDANEDDGLVTVTDKADGLSIDKDRINFDNQCPVPQVVSATVLGFPISYEFDYQPLCSFFTMLNPFVIGMGGFSSALIVGGVGRRG